MTVTTPPPPPPQMYYDYYDEMKRVKKYRRNMVGTIALGIILVIGTTLLIFRMWRVALTDCSWAILNRFFVPPFQFVFYGMMIFADPTQHLDTVCLFGRIMIPINALAYSAYMSYQSYAHFAYPELAFYILLIPIHLTTMLPETTAGVKYFRPFLKRPETEVEEERIAIIKKFQLPENVK